MGDTRGIYREREIRAGVFTEREKRRGVLRNGRYYGVYLGSE